MKRRKCGSAARFKRKGAGEGVRKGTVTYFCRIIKFRDGRKRRAVTAVCRFRMGQAVLSHLLHLLLFRGMSVTHNPAALWNRTYTWEMKRLSLSDWFGDCLAEKIYDFIFHES